MVARDSSFPGHLDIAPRRLLLNEAKIGVTLLVSLDLTLGALASSLGGLQCEPRVVRLTGVLNTLGALCGGECAVRVYFAFELVLESASSWCRTGGTV